jgi:hypothetical protein
MDFLNNASREDTKLRESPLPVPGNQDMVFN